MSIEFKISEFKDWIEELKSKIHNARRKAAYSVNSQLLELYWEIGKDISAKQEKSKWGSNFIEKIALELKHEFPEINGFSRRNIYAIIQWYKFYSAKYQFVPQSVAQIPWGHNRLIITKIKVLEEAEFYSDQVIRNGWDRDTLEIQIESNFYNRHGTTDNNFTNTLTVE
jgi:predicted nuclease of restriction endonuclease-like (RecB) superfamily